MATPIVWPSLEKTALMLTVLHSLQTFYPSTHSPPMGFFYSLFKEGVLRLYCALPFCIKGTEAGGQRCSVSEPGVEVVTEAEQRQPAWQNQVCVKGRAGMVGKGCALEYIWLSHRLRYMSAPLTLIGYSALRNKIRNLTIPHRCVDRYQLSNLITQV